MMEEIARELLKVARELVGAKIPSEIVEAVEAASSFMDVGKELKSRGIKYEFSTKVFPIYTIRERGKMIVVINKKYVDGADVIVGDIAIGEM